MNEIKEMAITLGEKIYQSEIYQSYLYYKNKVSEKPELQQKIEELKKLQLQQGLRKRQGEIVSFEQEERLSNVYSEVVLDADGLGFWESEKQLLLFMADILETVVKQASIDFSYADTIE